MAPRTDKPDKSADEVSAQFREMQLCLEAVTKQQTDFQNFLTTQLPLLIREQISSQSAAHSSSPVRTDPPQSTIKLPKITLSSFDGKDPLDWIFKAEHYFDLTDTPPPRRLILIPFFLQGPALSWFKWLHSNHLLTTWSEFLHALEVRFGPSSFANHEASLYKLQQTGSVLEYQQQFESLSNRVTGLSPTSLLNCFLSGLRKDIHHELSILKPSSLTQAIDLAKLIETKNLATKYPASRPTKPPFPPNNPQPSLLGPPPTVPIRRLTPAEQNERRSKGLCFNCDEKFHVGHRCTKKQFLIMLMTTLMKWWALRHVILSIRWWNHVPCCHQHPCHRRPLRIHPLRPPPSIFNCLKQHWWDLHHHALFAFKDVSVNLKLQS